MEQRINIAKLLKDCPIGMELDCTMFENVTFDEVITVICFDDKERVKIILSTHYSDGTKDEINLTEFGTYTDNETAKCVIFPKGKTTWEGFVPPCRFKDGDIVTWDDRGSLVACIYKERKNTTSFNHHIALYRGGLGIVVNGEIGLPDDELNFATEEERQKLFDAIKENGYRWNTETKTLEELIEPEFKIGDKIKHKNGKDKNGVEQGLILSITDDTYDIAVTNDMGIFVPIADQNEWELVPNKFDINTLVPFESRILVRVLNGNLWRPAIFGFFSHAGGCYVIGGGYWQQYIPYEGNEHLIGTTDDCDEYYITWK